MKLLSGAGVNVAGHKVPWTMVGAIAAVIGAFLVWKFNQGGGAVGAGQAGASNIPATTVSGDITTDPAFQNLTQQVSALGSAIHQEPTPSTNAGASQYRSGGFIGPPLGLFPQVQSQLPAFDNWLVLNQARPDISAALAATKWTDLQGEYLKETNQYPKTWK